MDVKLSANHKNAHKSSVSIQMKNLPLSDVGQCPAGTTPSRSEHRRMEELCAYLQHCTMLDYFVPHGNPEKELDLKLPKCPRRKHFFTSPSQWTTLSLYLCKSANWSMDLRRILTGKRRAAAHYNAKVAKHIDHPAAALGLDIQTVQNRVGYVVNCSCQKTKPCRSMPHGLARMAKWHSLKEKVHSESEAALEAIFGHQTVKHKITEKEVVLKDFVYQLIEQTRTDWFEDIRRLGARDDSSEQFYKTLTPRALNRCMDVPIFAMCHILGEKEGDPYGFMEAKIEEKVDRLVAG
ncbi:MAG: hypothetical protein MMC33_004762 [Icmadophila ericetorum]|nr:hypothetical protein [Icmadophila ericetorum]